MNKNEYNGWTNYETWNAKLWIDNDENEYNEWKERAENALLTTTNEQDEETYTNQDKDNAINELVEQLQDYMESNNPIIGTNSMYADLMQSALDEIDYYEIAESMINDLITENDYKEIPE